MKRTLALLSLLTAMGTHAACGTLEVPVEEEEVITGNPLDAPTITDVDPARGPLAGGNEVTLTGTGFAEGMSVVIGGNEATSVTIESGTTLVVTVPPGLESGRLQDVLVFGPTGFAELPEAYTYNTKPTLESASREFGALAGGTTVEVTGRFLEVNNPGTPTVTVGGIEASDVEVLDDSTIRFVTGEGNPDSVAVPQDIVVSTTNGTASLPEAFHYLRPGLLLSVNRSNGAAGHGIHYFDPESGRTLQLLNTGVGISRFYALQDGTLMMRLNREGFNRNQWARFDLDTQTLDFVGNVFNEAGGSMIIRATTQVGPNLIAIASNQLGFIDPQNQQFIPMASDGSFNESQGCLAAKDNDEIFHMNQLNGQVKTININTGATINGPNILSPLNDNPNNIKCHGAAFVGQSLIALFFDRNQPGGLTHVLSINPLTGASTVIALLGGSFSGMDLTPMGLFQ